MKTRLSLIAVLCIFVFGLFGTGCDNNGTLPFANFNSKSSIEKVLSENAHYAQSISPLREDLNPDDALDLYARGIYTYVSNASQFDSSSVPGDFAIAYKAHLRAWQRTADMYASHPAIGTFWSNVAEGFFRGLMGDVTGGAFEKEAAINEWASHVQAAEQEVRETWMEVLDVASKYGVATN